MRHLDETPHKVSHPIDNLDYMVYDIHIPNNLDQTIMYDDYDLDVLDLDYTYDLDEDTYADHYDLEEDYARDTHDIQELAYRHYAC